MTRRAAWLLGLVAAVVSACGSWIPSLWGDEAASVLSATRPLLSLARMLTHVDAVHGTFYFGLHWWVRIAGASPFAVRFPDAIAVGLAVVAVVLLVARLADPATAVVAGLICLLLPRMTYTGEEARSYAFSAAIAAWLLLVVDLARGRLRGTRWWVVYAALLALGVYVFLYLALFLAAHAVVLAASRARRRTWRAWAVAVICGLAATTPLLVLAVLERSQIASLAGDTTTDFRSLAVGLWFTTSLYAAVAWLLIVVATAFWVGGAVRSARASRPSEEAFSTPDGPATPRTPRTPSLELVGLAWLLLPGALLLLTNLVVADFTGRYLTMSAPGAALLIAAGLRRLAGLRLPRSAGQTSAGPSPAHLPVLGILTALVLASGIPAYLSQRTPYAKNGSDWAEISSVVGARSGGSGAIVFDESAKTSRNPRLALHTYPAGFRGLEDVTLRTPYADNHTWYDATYTVPQALALGRFDGITTVWLVEYSSGGTTDTSGLADLERAGYRVREAFRTHSSEILRLEK